MSPLYPFLESSRSHSIVSACFAKITLQQSCLQSPAALLLSAVLFASVSSVRWKKCYVYVVELIGMMCDELAHCCNRVLSGEGGCHMTTSFFFCGCGVFCTEKASLDQFWSLTKLCNSFVKIASFFRVSKLCTCVVWFWGEYCVTFWVKRPYVPVLVLVFE